MREELLRIPSATREDFVLHAHRFGPAGGDAPEVAIIAGLHGDEHNGIYVAARLVKRLSELPEGAFGGRVLIIPAVNVFGLNTGTRFWPFDDTDINRMFPGYGGGETTQRIAARVWETVAGATHLIDIHSSNEALREMPQVRLYEQDEAIVEEARAFGLPLIWRRTPNAAVANQLAYAFHAGVPNTYILQGGSARRINKRFADALVGGVARFLDRLGVTRGLGEQHDPPPAPTQVVSRTDIGFCYAPDAGIFVTFAETGDTVTTGQALGEILSPLDGATLARVYAPGAGTVMSLRVTPVVYQNDLLARVAFLEGTPRPEPDTSSLSREDYEMQ